MIITITLWSFFHGILCFLPQIFQNAQLFIKLQCLSRVKIWCNQKKSKGQAPLARDLFLFLSLVQEFPFWQVILCFLPQIYQNAQPYIVTLSVVLENMVQSEEI